MKVFLCLLVIGVSLVVSAPVNDLQKNEIARDILRDLLNHDDDGQFRDYIKSKVKTALNDPKYSDEKTSSDETESVFDQEEQQEDTEQQEAALLLNEDHKKTVKSDETEDSMKILSDELKDVPTNDIEKYLKSRQDETTKDNDVQTDLDYLFEDKQPKGPEPKKSNDNSDIASVQKDGMASPPAVPTEFHANDEAAPLLDEDYDENDDNDDDDEKKKLFEETLKDEIKKRVVEALHKREEAELEKPHVRDSLKELIKKKVRDALAKRFNN